MPVDTQSTFSVRRTVSLHPELAPPTSAEAATRTRRIVYRLSKCIGHLDDPPKLKRTIAAVTSEQTPANNIPEIYRV